MSAGRCDDRRPFGLLDLPAGAVGADRFAARGASYRLGAMLAMWRSDAAEARGDHAAACEAAALAVRWHGRAELSDFRAAL